MDERPFETICIVGAGFMGAQIGLRCAIYGYTVWLVDAVEAALMRAQQQYAEELDEWIARDAVPAAERETILARIHLTTDLRACLKSLTVQWRDAVPTASASSGS
jgi:3-hydroxybutyryl-CoA dehydrogenase